jgi:hypothetical protein
LLRDYILSDEIIFDAKPDAVPYNYRISYKIAQLCLIMSINCGKGGCSLYKLHMISVGMCTKREMEQLLAFTEGRLANYTVVRFDPAVNRAINYAIADNLVYQQINGLFRLTDKGRNYAKQIYKIEDLLVNEKGFLNKLAGSLSEEMIKTLMSSWRYSNVKN